MAANTKVMLQPAYLLHRRPYRETSMIMDVLTAEHGRVHLIARGARGARSKTKSLFMPFKPLVVSWQGRTDLYSLQKIEAQSAGYFFEGNRLVCAMYLNELLIRVLHRGEAYPGIFAQYQNSLSQLTAIDANYAAILRQFELSLLTALGYGIDFTNEAYTAVEIIDNQYYQFMPQQGFVKLDGSHASEMGFLGSDLLAISQGDFSNKRVARISKLITRAALSPLLGAKPLLTKALFV